MGWVSPFWLFSLEGRIYPSCPLPFFFSHLVLSLICSGAGIKHGVSCSLGECSVLTRVSLSLPKQILNSLVVQAGLEMALSLFSSAVQDVRPEPPALVDVCHNVLKQSLAGHICVWTGVEQ